MPTYRFTGPAPVTLGPPHRGQVNPGETVQTDEPLDHPDFQPATQDAAAAAAEPTQTTTDRRRPARTEPKE